MTEQFTQETYTSEIPYWAFYGICGESSISGYINGSYDSNYADLNSVFNYLSNTDISQITNNNYYIQFDNPSITISWDNYNTENLVPLIGIIKPTPVTDIYSTIQLWKSDILYAEALYGPIEQWDLTNVTNLDNLCFLM